MAKVLVLYCSAYGHIKEMAEAIAEGAQSAGAHVDIKRVLETVDREIAIGSRFAVLHLAAVRHERDRGADVERGEVALEAAVCLFGERCDGGHVSSPWLLGAIPRWRASEGQRAAVTERYARANPHRGLTALGEPGPQ
jgi:hypothetical protein